MAKDETLEFWFSIGSTYTYLSVARLKDVEAQTGVTFSWRPFNVRAIMREMDNIPFATKPIKAAYMWRDVERRAAKYGLAARVPAPYPLKQFDLANCVAILGAQEGWCAEYVRAAYRYWFVDGQEAGSEPNLSRSLRDAGQDPARVVALAQSAAIEQAYAAATDAARQRGVFGAPTFATRGEIFWGDDRLEDALAWHLAGRQAAPGL